MRIVAMALMAAVAARAGAAEEIRPARNVTVCVDPANDGLTVYAAEAMASEIFAEVDVAIQWYAIRQCPSKNAIIVSFSTEKHEEQPPLVLAEALPFEGTHIVVFLDRVKCRVEPALVITLVAYVLTHEITHILQGTDWHSDTGIMKASWSRGDYFDMGRDRLRFTRGDIGRLNDGIRARQSRLAEVAAASPGAP
jgi:hypothetical protein